MFIVFNNCGRERPRFQSGLQRYIIMLTRQKFFVKLKVFVIIFSQNPSKYTKSKGDETSPKQKEKPFGRMNIYVYARKCNFAPAN